MRRALELAARGQGRTSPNPMVGAVILQGERVVGEGFHPQAGLPHAEIFALEQAGAEARAATVYVNLEPCSHYGHTPPCVEALLEAGVGRVVVAVEDPDSRVQGAGIRRLREGGVGVTTGVLAAEALRLNEAYFHHRRTGYPWVIGKWAMSWDGKIAAVGGDSRWISGSAARRKVHTLRAQVDAVMVGSGTALQDDPLLTARWEEWGERTPERPRSPLRIVVDSRGRLPAHSQLVRTARATPTVVATLATSPPAWRDALAQAGAQVWLLPASEGRVDLDALLARLGGEEVLSVLVEGGGTVLAALAKAHRLNKVWVFLSPCLIGGQAAPTPLQGEGVRRVADALRLRSVHWEAVGDDLWLEGYLSEH